MSLVATLITLIGILGLFYLEYERKAKVSPAVWLPVVWITIAATRPVSMWFGGETLAATDVADGNPFERNIFIVLIACGLMVLATRGQKVLKILKANAPLLAYVIFALISMTWSDFPGVAFKRWIKFLGDFVMVLIVLTDKEPLTAMKRVLARPAFLIMPLSILTIRYFSDIGRYYSRWEGLTLYRGLSADKNMLGMACLVLGLGSSWRVLEEWRTTRNKHVLMAHGAIALMVVYLLKISDSMTSLSCFLIGSGLMFMTAYTKWGRKPALLSVAVPGLLIGTGAFIFFGGPLLALLGRDPTLTGRTVLWDFVLKMNPHAFFGAGFESFWLGDRLVKIWQANWWRPNQAHNGYIETYLNLGWIGIALVLTFIVSGYRKIIAMLKNDPEQARIRLAFFVVAVIYNYTEAAIKMMHPVWIAFLFATMAVPWQQKKLGANVVRWKLQRRLVRVPKAQQPNAPVSGYPNAASW